MIKKPFKTLLYLAIFLTLAQFAYALNIVELSPGYYPNTSRSRALSSADIYVGKPDLDPEIVGNQKTLSVQQEDGTIVAVTQPIHTNAGGVPQYLGSPVTLLVEGDYSLKVLDKNGVQIYYVPSTAYEQYLVTGNYYYPDYTEADQGVVGGGNTVTDILTEVGVTEKATMYFSHNSGGNTTTYTFATNTTITDNFNTIVEEGAILSIAITKTLIINGPFPPGPYQVFSGAGSVVLGRGHIKEVWISWWGASPDETRANNTTYIQKAITAVTETTGDATVVTILRMPAGTFNVNNGILTVPGNYSTGFHLQGAGWRNATVINGIGAGATLSLASTQYNVVIEDLMMIGDSDTTALIQNSATMINFRHLHLTGAQVGILVPGTVWAGAMYFDGLHIVNNSQFGIKLVDQDVGISVYTVIHINKCWITDNGSTTDHYQVYIAGGYSATFTNNVIANGAGARGVWILATGPGNGVVISGNECENSGFLIGNVAALNIHAGIVIFGNYFSGNPGMDAAITIYRADNLVSFGNDFQGLTAGKYAYDFANTVRSKIGPDYCTTNYYTGTLVSNCIVYGNSAGSGGFTTFGMIPQITDANPKFSLVCTGNPAYQVSLQANYNANHQMSLTGEGNIEVLGQYAGNTALMNGNIGIGTTTPTSKLQVVGLPIYANNAAATAAGLTAGAFYRTGADPDPVCVVH